MEIKTLQTPIKQAKQRRVDSRSQSQHLSLFPFVSAGMKRSKKEGLKNLKTVVSARLTEDIVECSILPRLPAKALLRFRCVSRRWHRLISTDPYFVYLQSLHGSSGFVSMNGSRFHFRTHISNSKSFGIPRASALIEGGYGEILASCSGIICIWSIGKNGQKIFMGNPALKDWVELPFPAPLVKIVARIIGCGLAVDVGESAARYSLVFLYYNLANWEYKSLVLSSKTAQWKVSKEGIMLPGFQWITKTAVYVKEFLYWKIDDHHALWFDPKEGHNGLQPLPQDIMVSSGKAEGRIGEWKGALSYATISSTGIELWAMHQSCWGKSHSISLEMILGCRMSLRDKNPREIEFNRLKVRKVRLGAFEGGALSVSVGDKMYCYELATGEFSKSDVDFSCLPYKNSLVSLSMQNRHDDVNTSEAMLRM